MGQFFLGYAIVTLLIVVAFYWLLSVARKRRMASGGEQIPPGFEPTAEISVNPDTGQKQRVWYNARTRQRFYENLLDGDIDHSVDGK